MEQRQKIFLSKREQQPMTLGKMAVKDEDLMGSRVKMIAVLYKTFLRQIKL